LAWKIEIERQALLELRQLATTDSTRIIAFLERRLAALDDPRSLGEPLAGRLSGFWKYRVGNYRIIASIEDSRVRILIVRIGHRREVYR
jgi:mRNA interferase RelE/StbE